MSDSPPRPRALVIGGARRVGRAICLSLARDGCDVVLTYNNSVDDARETLGLLTPGNHALAQLDLADAAGLPANARALAATHDTWDVLVYSASQYTPSPLASVTAERLHADMLVNAFAAAIIIQRVAPRMEASLLRGGAAIVAMLDIHALGRPRKNFLSYSMSKAALAELVNTLARELAPRIRVNAVAPGVVAWPEQGNESDPTAQAAYLARVPLNRAGTPEDAAEAVRWLALDARYTTGQVIRVDGEGIWREWER